MNTIIVIDRQFGSGGLEIAGKVAKYFAVPFYDKELIKQTAKESGFAEELIGNWDEKPGSSFISSLISESFSEMPLEQEIYFAQQETIRKIARESKQGCVIVGRCADVALRRHRNLVNIFIHAAEPFRMERIRTGKAGNENDYHDFSDEKLLELMRRKDKERWSYYDFYSQQKWGQAKNYDFTINSGFLGIDESISVITELIETFEKNGGQKRYITEGER